MLGTISSRVGHRAGSAYSLERLTTREAIRPWLNGEADYAAYAMAQLEPRVFPKSEWWSATGEMGRALLVFSQGSLGNALVTLGDAGALDVLLGLRPGPRVALANFQAEHLAVVRSRYLLSREELMLRMNVTAETFRAVQGETRRLRGADIVMVNRLYATEDWPSHYSASVLAEGVYYGAFIDGQLVSVAGTHAVAPTEGVALVGNVFTHPRYRCRGLASLVTSAVTRSLLEVYPRVLLTVESSNVPALRVYGKLGYRAVCSLYETSVMRRQTSGLMSLIRRVAYLLREREPRAGLVQR